MKKLLSALLIASMTTCAIPALSAFAAESTDILSQPRYELENATLTKDDIRNGGDDTVSGGKFVGGFDNGEQTATLTVTAPKAGAYALTVGFITMDGGRQFDVTVNGKTINNVTCGASGSSWEGDVKTCTVVVALNAGENTVVLGQDSGFGPSIDYIEFAEITDGVELTVGKAVKIEAENAYVVSGVSVSDSEVASGGKLVNDIGGENGNADRYLEFVVDAPAAGKASLVIYYFCAAERNIELSVNGGDATVISVANNNTWGNPDDSAATAHEVITVDLQEGVNSLKLYNSTGWGPNLDYVEITVVEAENEDDDVTDGGTDPDPDTGIDTAPSTGDAVTCALVLAAIALTGTAIAVSKKRRITE